MDESSFGAHRVRGERGVEPGVKQSSSESWNDRKVYSGGWRGYNGLVDMGYQKHLRVHRFIYTSKNVNSDFIIERKISMIKYSLY